MLTEKNIGGDLIYPPSFRNNETEALLKGLNNSFRSLLTLVWTKLLGGFPVSSCAYLDGETFPGQAQASALKFLSAFSSVLSVAGLLSSLLKCASFGDGL